MKCCENVQIKNGKIAVEGIVGKIPGPVIEDRIFDIMVLDIKTGKEICRCSRDFNFPSTKIFFLQREKILAVHEDKIYSANFWF